MRRAELVALVAAQLLGPNPAAMMRTEKAKRSKLAIPPWLEDQVRDAVVLAGEVVRQSDAEATRLGEIADAEGDDPL